MPKGDKTGPAGQGPMTGRRMGYCAGFDTPGFVQEFGGRGFGFRRGFGRGFGRFGFGVPFVQPQVITEKEEKKILQEDLQVLREEVEEIEKRLKEIK